MTLSDENRPSETEIRHLVEDIAYLKIEAEALVPVIEFVPFDEDPGDGHSILSWLQQIDFAQTHYTEPLIRSRGQDVGGIAHPSSVEGEFLKDEMLMKLDSKTLLEQIQRNRERLLHECEMLTPEEWMLPVEVHDHQTERLLDVVKEMVRWERRCLKHMADRVLVYQNEQQSRREIRQKRSARHHGNGSQPE